MMQPWFEDSKFGIFIHWGAYAIGRRGGESWPLCRAEVSYTDYLEEMKQFDAADYDPAAWADLFKRAGAQYAVLTTKHHDGVTLWPNTQGSPSIPHTCGTGDLVGPFVEALREAGLHTGLYFSHTDWVNVPHLRALSGLSEEEIVAMQQKCTNWHYAIGEGGKIPPGPKEQEEWTKFIAFHRAQIGELLQRYNPVDLIWFDVHWGHDRLDYRFPELRDFIHSFNEKTVINSRMAGYGDYETPEQFIPVYPPEGPWELCLTTNDTWSYTGSEKHYKTPYELVTMFCECLGMGGNLLLNVGPDEHGIIPEQQVVILEAIGGWIERNKDAVYGTRRGLPAGYSYNFSSMNKEKTVLYVYLTHLPSLKGGATSIKGIRNEIKAITLLGSGKECSHQRVGGAPWLNVPGALFVTPPEDGLDPLVSVLKIEFEGTLDLYSGEGVEIDVN